MFPLPIYGRRCGERGPRSRKHKNNSSEQQSSAPSSSICDTTAIDIQLSPDELQSLFDACPDIVFFIKNMQCRYTHVNLTLLQRLGMRQREDVIGKTSAEVYPARMGRRYLAQDRRTLSGEIIENLLELQLYANRSAGWCLTVKRPLQQAGRIVGLIGISRDLGAPDRNNSSYARLQRAVEHMQTHYSTSLRISTLAAIAEISVAQLERLFKHVFQITPQQMLTKLRIDEAMRLLHTEASIAEIGQACGFSDQSAFARQFKATVGMPPRDYRALTSS